MNDTVAEGRSNEQALTCDIFPEPRALCEKCLHGGNCSWYTVVTVWQFLNHPNFWIIQRNHPNDASTHARCNRTLSVLQLLPKWHSQTLHLLVQNEHCGECAYIDNGSCRHIVLGRLSSRKTAWLVRESTILHLQGAIMCIRYGAKYKPVAPLNTGWPLPLLPRSTTIWCASTRTTWSAFYIDRVSM